MHVARRAWRDSSCLQQLTASPPSILVHVIAHAWVQLAQGPATSATALLRAGMCFCSLKLCKLDLSLEAHVVQPQTGRCATLPSRSACISSAQPWTLSSRCLDICLYSNPERCGQGVCGPVQPDGPWGGLAGGLLCASPLPGALRVGPVSLHLFPPFSCQCRCGASLLAPLEGQIAESAFRGRNKRFRPELCRAGAPHAESGLIVSSCRLDADSAT